MSPKTKTTTPLNFHRRRLADDQPRHMTTDPCAGCAGCQQHNVCEPARGDLRGYPGIRLTSDGFDCALPVSIDSHSHCSYGCLYCFSDNLMQHQGGTTRGVGQTSLLAVEKLFAGEPGKDREIYQKALRYDRRNAAGYPCPVQLGAINDPCDHIERQQGWLLRFIDLAIKYRQPVRISTKGTIFLLPEYLDRIAQAPHLFWVTFSMISGDDEIVKAIDRRAPLPSERLKTMAALSKVGVKTALRFRPILPGISDSTAREPDAYRVLIERAAAAGASAISYEVAFVPGAPQHEVAKRWARLEAVAKVPFRSLYRSFGPRHACMRPAYTWSEHVMHAIRDVAKAHGMAIGVSDPVWKQLGDTGCCCGMLPDDPVWGNWQPESATNRLLEAQADPTREIGPEDVTPAWAHDANISMICNAGVGPLRAWKTRHHSWADEIRRKWNDLKAQRGPLEYFQGALQPSRVDAEGNIYYKWRGLTRQHKRTREWKV